jgi:hypothetical protein
MDKKETEIAAGQRAEQILTDPVFIAAREHIDAELYRLFTSAVPTDLEALSQIKAMQYMHGKYLQYLQKVVNDGKLAKLDVERKPRHSASEFGYR